MVQNKNMLSTSTRNPFRAAAYGDSDFRALSHQQDELTQSIRTVERDYGTAPRELTEELDRLQARLEARREVLRDVWDRSHNDEGEFFLRVHLEDLQRVAHADPEEYHKVLEEIQIASEALGQYVDQTTNTR